MVVYIHGGGWVGGDKFKFLRGDVINVVRELNQRGITCASIEYRLADGGEGNVNDSVADCMDAVRFLAKHADQYGIDPNRIGTFGSSAGGHLTLMTALVSFIDHDLMKGSNFENPQFVPILGGPIEVNRELAKKLSPIEWIRADSPPIFLAHGDANCVKLNHMMALDQDSVLQCMTD